MRPKKTHAEPIQPVADGERHGFLYRWNTGEVQVMWISDESMLETPRIRDQQARSLNNIEAKL